MSLDSQIKIALSTTGVSKGAVALSQTFADMKGDIRTLTGFTEKFNKAGKLTGFVIRGLDKDGQVLSRTLRKQGAEWKVVSENVRQATREMALADRILKQVVLRIGGIQLFHQTFRMLLSQMSAGIQTARDFSKRIAEIQSITLDAAKSTEQWQRQLRAVSDAYGRGLLENAEASYQALSNQVVNASNVTNFLVDSTRLATVAVGTTDEAVNILSSSINAYGKSAFTANVQSAIFFKTVEQGRLRLSDLANDYGTSANMANQLGVSMLELNASLATLTRSGIRTAQAQTLINAVMQKMVQPTKEMKKTFQEWGVVTGEQAIQSFGLLGVLQKLGQEVESGGASRLATLFSRLRAQRGGAALINSGEFGNILEEIGGTPEKMAEAVADMEQAYEQAFNTIGARADRAGQAIENFFVVDVAQDFLELLLNMNDAVGGLQNVFEGIFQPITLMANLTSGVLDFIGMVPVADNASKAWGETLGNIIISLTAGRSAMYLYTQTMDILGTTTAATAGKAASLGLAVGSWIFTFGTAAITFDLLTDSTEEYEQALSKIIQTQQRASALQFEVEGLKQEEAFRAVNAELARLTKEYSSLDDVISQRLSKNLANATLLTAAFRRELEITAATSKAIVKDALEGVADSAKNIASAQEKLQKLKTNVFFTDVAKGLQAVQSAGGNGGLMQLILGNDFDKATGILEQNANILGAIERVNSSALSKARSELDKIKKTISDIRQSTTNEAFELALGGQTDGQKIRTLGQEIQRLRQGAGAASPKQAAEMLERAQSLAKQMTSLRSSLVSGLGVGVSTDLFEEIGRERLALQEQIQQSKTVEVKELETQQAAIQQEVLKNLKQQEVINAKIAQQTQRRAEQELRIVEAQERFEQIVQRIQTQQKDLRKAREDAAASLDQAITSLPSLATALRDATPMFGGGQAAREAQSVYMMMDDAINRQDFDSIRRRAGYAKFATNVSVEAGASTEGQAQLFRETLEQIRQAAITATNAQRELADINSQVNSLNQGLPAQNVQDLDDATKGLISSFREIKDVLDGLKVQGKQPARATGGTIDSHLFYGNPDEMVVNRFASRRFSPQLMALNAGVTGNYSTVNRNVEIGSVNVNLQSSGNTTVDAQALGHAINREIRKGTFAWGQG